MVRSEAFGVTKEGRPVETYRITNGAGMEVDVMTYGACITRILVPDRDGVAEDVALGYATLREYEENPGYLGASVGRNANRIGNASFTLDGERYELDKNDNECNNLHGGFQGWSMRVWDAEICGESAVAFSLKSPHLDQGFPGEMHVRVTYTVTEDSELQIRYDGVSDRDTVYNPTNHTYFNLSGKLGGKTVLDQCVRLLCSAFTPADEDSIPYGTIVPVEGTPMDFREMKPIGRDIGAEDRQLRFGNGYDHNWMVDGEGYRTAAILFDPESGRRMTVKTDLPAMQMYTANFLDGTATDRTGRKLEMRTGVCFETQFPPDAPNKPAFPSSILPAGKPFVSVTSYRFDTVPKYDLISVGEALIDFLPGDAPQTYLAKPGGAPANCAVSAARMGVKTAFCGRVGADDFGALLLRTLRENGVTPLCTEGVREACTTMAFVTLDEHGDRSFTFARKPGADMFLKSEDLPGETLGFARAVHAGSCSLSKGSAAGATKEILHRAHEAGKLVSCDLNYRDVMWDGDEQAAIAAVYEVLGDVDLLKVSDSEAEMLGGEGAFPELMEKYGITAVVETLGGDGAKCWLGGEVIAVPVVPADCVDATGAGDAFWGAFLSAVLEAETVNTGVIREAMERGAVAGSLCVRRKGAMEALPTAAEVAAFRAGR